MDGKQLKNSILQWAIQGKLVPQDPNDEPAIELLHRINPQIRPITEDTPFDIPNNWCWVKHNDLFEVSGGSQPPKSNFIDTPREGYVRLFQTRDYGEKPMPVYVPKNMVSKFTKKEDILLARYGGSLGKVFWAEEGAYNVALAKVIPLYQPELINKRYIFVYYCSSIYQSFTENASRSAQAGFNKTDLNELLFPLPPLAEQQRIVARIEELMPLVERYAQAQASLDKLNGNIKDKLKKSILQEAIQGKLMPQDPNDEPAIELLHRINPQIRPITEDTPFDIPNNWCWVKMGDIGDWGAGATPPKGEPSYYNGDILWLRTGELNNGIVYDTEIKITEKALKECSLRLNKVGDVLIAMYGATIGKVAIVGKEMTTNQACCACTPFEVYNYYLFYFLMASKSDFVKKGEGGAQPNISREKLIHHLIPLPPLAEQQRIVARIEELFAIVENINS